MTGFAFPKSTLGDFARAYPDRHAPLRHKLTEHPLLTHAAIAALAERLPEALVEYNPGALPLGVDPANTPKSALSIIETIRTIGENGSWMVLKNVERDPAYGALLDEALADLRPIVERSTGRMEHREAFLFLTSPGSVTPFHMDPEHNILLQIQGAKMVAVFPASDEELVPPAQSEAFHQGGHRNLIWDDRFMAKASHVPLGPGDALLVPVKAPHFVRNGDEVSISFSITWRSERSVAESELHSLNRLLRARGWPLVGVSPRPEKQRIARLGYRVMRKFARGSHPSA